MYMFDTDRYEKRRVVSPFELLTGFNIGGVSRRVELILDLNFLLETREHSVLKKSQALCKNNL